MGKRTIKESREVSLASRIYPCFHFLPGEENHRLVDYVFRTCDSLQDTEK